MVVRFRLVRNADIASWPMPGRSAIAVSSNLALAPNNNPHYWRFAGREGTNGAVHDAAGPELHRLMDPDFLTTVLSPIRMSQLMETGAQQKRYRMA